MRVKNYLVENLSSVAKKIKEELGDNAVIIKSKQLHDGRYEVIAAAEPESTNSMAAPKAASRNYANLTSSQNLKEVKFPTARRIKSANDASNLDMLPEILKQVLFILNNSGMSTTTALEFVRKNCHSWERYEDPEELLRDSIIVSTQTIVEVPDGAHFFVGYPGEGKTSLIMKTAHHLRENGRLVAILNLDHTKIGAGDDLEKFAGWSGFGFLNIDDLSDLGKLRKNGVVCLIDTPGNLTYEMITSEPFRAGHIHLVCDVSRNLPGPVWQQIKSHNNYLALTRLDYMNEPGLVLQKYIEIGRPLSFSSTGPKAPDDFELFSSYNIANSILGNKENKGNIIKTWMNKFQKIRKSS